MLPGILDNEHDSRLKTAGRILEYVANHAFSDGEALNIVAHSHGGNVVKLYSGMDGARTIDTLVSLGTPQTTEDSAHNYSIRADNVGTYVHVYSNGDFVVPRAGGEDGHVFDVTKYGPAGNIADNAYNVDATWLPGVGCTYGCGTQDARRTMHSELPTGIIWRFYVSPTLQQLRKGKGMKIPKGNLFRFGILALIALSILMVFPIPFRKYGYLDWARNAPENSIDLVRLKYLFPREWRTKGYPLPGGGFGLFSDPHFFATKPVKVLVGQGSSSEGNIYAQGFDTNYHFERSELAEHVLAIKTNDKIYEVSIPEVKFIDVIGNVHSLGLADGKAVFLIPAVFNRPDESLLVFASWPPRNESGITVASGNAEEWSSYLVGLAESQFSDLSTLCSSKSKSAHSIFESISGEACLD